MISLATSRITKEIRANVKKAFDDNRIGQGSFIKEFEDKVAEYVNTKYAVAVCNGTVADIIALLALKTLRPDKTEVIVPALTFIAHTNSVIFAGLKPIFVDVRYNYQIDPNKIEKKITHKTLAIMPANLLGIECDMEAINLIAKNGAIRPPAP